MPLKQHPPRYKETTGSPATRKRNAMILFRLTFALMPHFLNWPMIKVRLIGSSKFESLHADCVPLDF